MLVGIACSARLLSSISQVILLGKDTKSGKLLLRIQADHPDWGLVNSVDFISMVQKPRSPYSNTDRFPRLVLFPRLVFDDRIKGALHPCFRLSSAIQEKNGRWL